MKTDSTIQTLIDKIDSELERLIPKVTYPHNTLYQGAHYALFSGGKRIRPLLTLAITDLLNHPIQEALYPACALELVHTYSLIHDDLPCMDDDDLRRGKPTLHKVYSEGHAVLVGDFLLTHAFEILAKAPHLGATQKLQLITILTSAAGGEGMVGGQVLDLAHDRTTSLEDLHAKKTGALFTAALQFGGVIGGASQTIFANLTTLGARLGLLFQIIDDILDQENNFSKENVEHHYDGVLEALEEIPGKKELLYALFDKILSQLPLGIIA